MTSACLAMIAPPFSPSTTTAAAAVDQFQFQFQSQFQPQFQCLPRLQEVKGLLPLHFHAQPTKFDPHPSNLDPLSLGLGITEQCTRHSRILSYLMSPSASTSALGSNIQMMPINIDTLMQMPPEQTELLVQFLGRLSPSSLLTVDPSGRILFTGNPSEMRDLLSILAEFNTPPVIHQPHHHTSNVSLLVPYFDRTRGRAKAASRVALLNYPTETVVPSKSNGINKTKSQKKRQKKTTNYNRDIFQKNYFHVCESLLTLLLDKNSTSTGRGTGAAILSLKKLGPEIAHILTSFSIGIAGTGLAVLFSVACKTAGPGTRLPISATRVFNTGFGFGLFWLSWAVNGLRDTIVQVFKDSNKLNMKDEETMTLKVERSMRDVLFRAGTLVALAALRFA